MDWTQTKFNYYLDFVLVPSMVLFTLWCAMAYGNSLPQFVAALPIGAATWSLLEYGIHRFLFHRAFKPEHWLHHMRPAGYVAAPAWITAAAHVSAFCAFLGSFGTSTGSGLFIGLEAGYFAYIYVHDRIHHQHFKPGGWLRQKWKMHMLHHGGAEVNFGVVTQFWDHVFGTFQAPRKLS